MWVDEVYVVIIIFGCDKGYFGWDDIMLIDFDGYVVGIDVWFSVEIVLYMQVYCCWFEMQVVLYIYLCMQSVVLCLFVVQGVICFEGWELQKVIIGFYIYESVLEIFVFLNIQYMLELVVWVDVWLDVGKLLYVYFIDGYGIYIWGCSMVEMCCYLEVLEFLFVCEFDLRRLFV